MTHLLFPVRSTWDTQPDNPDGTFTMAVRQTANRGPLLIVYDKARELGFLDE
jgi:hypothetical protein